MYAVHKLCEAIKEPYKPGRHNEREKEYTKKVLILNTLSLHA
jgi:hypothetical protein